MSIYPDRITSIVVFLSIVAITLISCKKEIISHQKEVDATALDKLYNDIQEISQQVGCENATEWKFVAVGSKACGGVLGYIAYSNKIDTGVFLAKVKEYTTKQAEYTLKYGVISDCSITKPPKGVTCESGKPKFVY